MFLAVAADDAVTDGLRGPVRAVLVGHPEEGDPPVIGETKPILISRPTSGPALTVVVAPAAVAVVVAPAVVVVVAGAAVVVVDSSVPPQAATSRAESTGHADRRARDAGHFKELATAD